MNSSIIDELENHLRDLVNDDVLTLDNKDDWHFHAFNEDFYIIGYYEASEWLKKHDLDAFEAVALVIEEQELHFGESTLNARDVDSEGIANLIVYFSGFKALSNIEDELIELLGQ